MLLFWHDALQHGETFKYPIGQIMAQSSRAVEILRQDKYITISDK